MARSLRSKLAMALCCTVITTTAGQVNVVFAEQVQNEAALSGVEANETEDGKEKKDPWEDRELADAAYYGAIKVYKIDEDKDSMAAACFTQDNLPIRTEGNKVYLKLKVSKDFGNRKDAITSLEQKTKDGYRSLTMNYLDQEDVRYIVTEVEIEDITEPVVLRCGIDTGIRPMQPEMRILLTQDTIEALKQMGIGQTKDQVTMKVIHTDETAFKAEDGSISFTAAGGQGEYEYTIDGGSSWHTQDKFEMLKPGTYSVAVRDSREHSNVTVFEEIIIAEKQQHSQIMPEGKYKVAIEVLHETQDQPSHAAEYFTKEDLELNIQENTAHLSLRVQKDKGEYKDIIQGLDVKSEEGYQPVDLTEIEEDGVRYIKGEVSLKALDETVYVRCNVKLPFMEKSYSVRVKLSKESIDEILKDNAPGVKPENPTVEAVVDKTEVEKGTITITASGGSGSYEYTIDGGKSWHTNNQFTGLQSGTYTAGARDIQNTENVSSLHQVIIPARQTADEELKDGSYSANLNILHETQDIESMAAVFFNKDGLPLRIRNGKAYLTIQVLKDGMGMRDVITYLGQRINGSYQELQLNYLNDSSKRYVTAEVEFESIDEPAYVKCGIAPMQGMMPVLRIKLDKESIKPGSGEIKEDLDLKEDVVVNKVEAENGKVTVHLSGEEEDLKAEDFTAKLYSAQNTNGSSLKLKDFRNEKGMVTFTFDKINAAEKDQQLTVGITFKQKETRSNTFTVKGQEADKPDQNLEEKALVLKENAKEIKYIKGCGDGTFRPNARVTKAEALTMLSRLVDKGQTAEYYLADISVLHSTKDESSMAAQFFKQKDIAVKKQKDGYLLELEIANEGMGFKDIITKVEQKSNGSYKTLEVRKSQDMKKAYVTLEVQDLKEAIVLRTGISPLGSVAPELRIMVDTKSLKETEFTSSFTDINMWAKDAIMLFEEAGMIGGDGDSKFRPSEEITRAEFVRLITLIAGLDIEAPDNTHQFKDVKGHKLEKYVAAAVKADYIHGCGDNTFKPDASLTRAEAVKVINRLAGNHNEEINEGLKNPFRDLSEKHWAYYEILRVAGV